MLNFASGIVPTTGGTLKPAFTDLIMKNNQIIFTLREAGRTLRLNDAVFAPETIESITYEGRRALLTLTHEVTEIDGYAVNNAYDLESVALPASIEHLNGLAFEPAEETVRLEGPLASADGLLLIKDGTLLAYADRNAREIVLPDTVRALAERVFSTFAELEKITLPARLERIGAHAFDTCMKLREVVWPDTLQTLGDRAFYNCGITRLDLPDSVTTLGEGAFAYCESLTSVHLGDSVGHVGTKAFCSAPVQQFTGRYATEDGKLLVQDQTVLAVVAETDRLTLPEGVERIAPYAFYRTTVARPVQLPASVKEIGAHAFASCDVEVNLNDGLEVIGEYAFCCNGGMHHVHLPESVREIGDGAFGGCGVQQFSGRYATADGQYLIQDGRLLGVADSEDGWYEVPEGVTYIGAHTFRYLENTNRVVLPEGVTAIGRQAFDCEDGSEWTFLTLPSSLRTIGDYAFSHLRLKGPLELPEGLEHIGQGAFSYAELYDAHVVIPSTVQTLGDWAFYDLNYRTDEKAVVEFPGDRLPQLAGSSVFTGCQTIRVSSEVRMRCGNDALWQAALRCDGSE